LQLAQDGWRGGVGALTRGGAVRGVLLAGSVVAVSVVGGGEVAVVQGGGESLTGQGVLGAYDRGFPSAAGRLLLWCGRAAWATGTGCSMGWWIDSRIRDRLGPRSEDRVGPPGLPPGSTNRIGIRRAGSGGLGGRGVGRGGT